MTLYYTLVFVILVTEMAVFLLMVAPLPRPVRKQVLSLFQKSAVWAKVTYSLRFTFIFILILFIDSVNRVYRVQLEVQQLHEGGGMSHPQFMTDRSEVQARKFYAQRNMYLCGFTLFLSLILNQTYALVVNLMNAEERLSKEGGQPLVSPSETDEIAELKKEIRKKDQDIEILKKQASALSREYMSVSDKVNAGEKAGDKKND